MLALCSSATCTIILAPTTQIFFNQNKMFNDFFKLKNSKAILFLRSELLEQTVSCNMNIEYVSKRYVYCIKLIFCRDNIGTCRAGETTHHPHRPPPDRSINPILTGGEIMPTTLLTHPPAPDPPDFHTFLRPCFANLLIFDPDQSLDTSHCLYSLQRSIVSNSGTCTFFSDLIQNSMTDFFRERYAIHFSQ